MRQRGREPSTSAKIGIGLVFSGIAPLVMLGATLISHDGASKASSAWLFGTYGAVGLGELCLSSMGLSLVSKTAPAALRASMMGGWFLTTAIGLRLSGLFGEVYSETKTESAHVNFWIVISVANLVCAVIVFLLPVPLN